MNDHPQTRPVLWHIAISHYNEKARWGLAYKGVEHERREPMPGAHMLYALWLTRGRGKTFPLLQLDGRAICDSTAIIAALEERWPEPALYPSDPGDRERALALEDWFDEEVAPHVRLLAFHEIIGDTERVAELFGEKIPRRLRGVRPVRSAMAWGAGAFTSLRFDVRSEEAAAEARERIPAGFDRLEAELGDGDYLVGDSFTVADLTAASLLYPVVRPPEGPTLPELPPALEEFCAQFEDRRGYLWVEETFRRHRKPAPEPARAGA